MRGKVKAEAPAGTVTIESGRKAVLTTQASPLVAVDDPLVQDLLAMYPWVEAERKAGRIRILATSIQVYQLENDGVRQAVLMEVPNLKTLPNDTCRIGETSLIGDAQFYDLSGNLLPYDLTKTGNEMGFYEIHFPQPVAVKGTFRMIAAGNMTPRDAKTLKEGSLRYFTMSNGTPCALNYYQVILPKGAVYVDANLPVTAVKELGGRTAVTIRNYRGQYGNSRIIIAFLWPDKDGTSLEDLPPQYRGLRDARDEKLAEEYHEGIRKIRGGGEYKDQSDPVRAVLAWSSAAVRQDKVRLRQAQYLPFALTDEDFDKVIAKGLFAQLAAEYIEGMDFLGTPAWPETPEEGYIHPVYMSWPGSHLRKDTVAVIYTSGQWLRCGDIGNPWNTDVNSFKKMFQSPHRWRLDISPRGIDEIPWNSIGAEALGALRSLLAKDDQDAAKWAAASLRLAGGGEFEYALDGFARCESLSANDDNAFLAAVWQGHMYDALGKRSDAVAKYKAALAMAGGRSIAHKQWDIVIDGKWIQARLAAPFRPEMIHAPADPASLREAYVSFSLQDTDELLKNYDNFRKQDVRDPIAWCYLGSELMDKQKWDQALDAFARAEACQPIAKVRLLSLACQGLVLDILGQRDQAVARYKAALEVDYPDDIRMDRWKIVLNKAWLQGRLAEPFTKDMLAGK